MKHAQVAELGYSKESNQVEITVPHGTKSAELHSILSALQSGGFIARLPRGCAPCLSGQPFNIRERLEWVVRVDLATKSIIEE